ncbi:hypothetical protein POPA111323_07465 [Polynucleobacter paneuropaeus]
MKLIADLRANNELLEGGACVETADSSMFNVGITTKPKQHW